MPTSDTTTADPADPGTPELLWVDPARIRPHPDNPRKDLGDLTGLADSIRAQGVLEPLLVEPAPGDDAAGDGLLLLLSGHRRLAAAAKAGVTTVPVVVHPAGSPAAGVDLERMLTANLQRVDLTPIEEGDAYQQLLDLPGGDYTTAKIAKRLGHTRKHVGDAIKTAKLPESARDRILSGQLTIDDAAALAQFASDPDAMERIERAADQGPAALRTTIEYEKRRADRDKAVAKEQRRLRKQGFTVLASADCPDEATDLDELFDEQITDPEDLEKVIADHQPCPGHAALIDLYPSPDGTPMAAPTAIWVCTDPEKYHPDLFPAGGVNDDGPPVAGEDTDHPEDAARKRREQEDAERRARDELDLKLAAAATVRRHHLGTVLTQPEHQDLAKPLILQRIDRSLSHTGAHDKAILAALADVLLPNLPESKRDDRLVERIRKALDRLTVAQLVIVDDIRTGLSWDTELEHSPRSSWSAWTQPADTPAGKWRARLEGTYGYQWSPVEREQLPTLDGGETA